MRWFFSEARGGKGVTGGARGGQKCSHLDGFLGYYGEDLMREKEIEEPSGDGGWYSILEAR